MFCFGGLLFVSCVDSGWGFCGGGDVKSWEGAVGGGASYGSLYDGNVWGRVGTCMLFGGGVAHMWVF